MESPYSTKIKKGKSRKPGESEKYLPGVKGLKKSRGHSKIKRLPIFWSSDHPQIKKDQVISVQEKSEGHL